MFSLPIEPASLNFQITKSVPSVTYVADFKAINIIEQYRIKTSDRHFSLNFAAQISEKYI